MTKNKETKISESVVARVARWRQGEAQPPVKIDAEIDTSCNLNCIYCSQKEKKENVEGARWEKLVREAAELGVLQWNFEGLCEPLTQPKKTMRVMKRIKEEGIYGSITTNGTLWQREQLQTLVEIEWDRIHFSVDGLPRTHDALTQVTGSFKKTLDTIEQLRAVKRDEKKDRPLIAVNFVLNQKNYRELPDLVQICSDLDVAFLFVDPIMPHTRIGESLKINDASKVEPYIQKSKKRLKEHKMDSNIDYEFNNLRPELIENTGDMSPIVKKESNRYEGPILGARCLKPWYNIWINHRGDLGYCSGNQTLGTIQQNSLESFWFGDKMEGERERLKQRKANYCSHCPPSFISQRETWRDKLAKKV